MSPETIEKIEQYLSNEMSPAERNDFELQLSSDKELSNEFELYKTIHTTMSASPDENELRQTLQQMNRRYFNAGGKVRQGSFKVWVAVAASLTIITVLCFYLLLPPKHSAEELYADFAKHTAVNVQLRGSQSDTLAQRASLEFNKKNYKSALPLLKEYLQQQPADIQMNFSLGICYLETADYVEAEEIFSTIAAGQTAYAEAAKWYLALSALKQNDLSKCRSILNSIPQTSSYFTRAKELLEKLPG